MSPRLLIYEGGEERVYEIRSHRTVVGRAPDIEVCLSDSKTSRHHCEIVRHAQGYKLVDLESRNGTRVNDDLVNQKVLTHGDVIHIGEAEIVFDEGVGKIPSRPGFKPAEPAASQPPSSNPATVRDPAGSRAQVLLLRKRRAERTFFNAFAVGIGVILALIIFLLIVRSLGPRTGRPPAAEPPPAVVPQPAPMPPPQQDAQEAERVRDAIRRRRFDEAFQRAATPASRDQVLKAASSYVDGRLNAARDYRKNARLEEAHQVCDDLLEKLGQAEAFKSLADKIKAERDQ
jgi:predicted component of type VI protein secretion system